MEENKLIDTFEGVVEHIIFRNEENGFTVMRVKADGEKEATIVVGALAGVQPGERIDCEGGWKNDKRFGRQFQVRHFEVCLPTSNEGIERYLASGIIAGVGAAFAERIVAHFGDKTFDILDNDPIRLRDVPGIGKKKWEKIVKSWYNQRAGRHILVKLQNTGISMTYAQRIYKLYGEETLEKLEENPYQLTHESIGMGFKRADDLAKGMGMDIDSPKRVDAGVKYAFDYFGQQGHTCYPIEKFTDLAAQLLSIAPEKVMEQLTEWLREKRAYAQTVAAANETKTFLWSKLSWQYEQGIAEELFRLQELDMGRKVDPKKWARMLDEIAASLKIELASQQYQSLLHCATQQTHIITGGPGTGKSTMTKILTRTLDKFSQKYILAAPTGRAAKRLEEITKRNASTIHSLLAYDPSTHSFRKGKRDKLEGDVLIVDEASMVDNFLFYSLLKAMPETMRLILIGDIDQLPSVGAGNVLKDCINSKKIKVSRLTDIFRQAQSSTIVLNAHRIRDGVSPDIRINKKADFFFIPQEQTGDIQRTLVSLLTGRLEKTYKLDPMRDIQVLTPMNKGDLGTLELNNLIQGALQANVKQQVQRGQVVFKLGDKVIQTRNNYDKGVFNGDIGFIDAISTDDKSILVEYEQGSIEYEFSELIEIELAYAVTVHKYQGSESPCIVMPIHSSHHRLLSRHLLYTGLTRGKKLVVWVGEQKGLEMGIRNDRAAHRYTGLCHVLSGQKSTGLPTIEIAPSLTDPNYEQWAIEQDATNL